jgi:tetratricopeptide (TPR) repeat protein
MWFRGRPVLVLMVLLAVAALARPAYPQATGRIMGTISDADGQPVAGASVVMASTDGAAREFEATTDDEGNYLQVGLLYGRYRVTAQKEGVGTRATDVTVQPGGRHVIDLELLTQEAAVLGSMSEEERAEYEKGQVARAAFNEGVAATRGGNHDEAIAKFNEALESQPDCTDCHHNLGIVYTEMKDYARAEAAFKKVLELDADNADAYGGLTSLYNAQRRFDEAAEASAQATRLSGGGAAQGGSASAVFDQGLVFWNAGRVEEAKKQFEETLRLDPDHGEVHYWLGMANLNAGNVPDAAAELKLYLEREPDGRFAEQAKGMLGQLEP